jgi:hypothetical protein
VEDFKKMSKKFVNSDRRLVEVAKMHTNKASVISYDEFVKVLKFLSDSTRTKYLDIGDALYYLADNGVNPFSNTMESPGDCVGTYNSRARFSGTRSLLGFQKLKSGAPYYGVYFAGTAYDIPAYGVVYYDKEAKTLRGYVPLFGNLINLDTMAALGDEGNSFYFEDAANQYISEKLLPKSFNVTNPDYDDLNKFTKVYVNKFGFKTPADACGDWDAIAEDLEAALG